MIVFNQRHLLIALFTICAAAASWLFAECASGDERRGKAQWRRHYPIYRFNQPVGFELSVALCGVASTAFAIAGLFGAIFFVLVE